MWMSAHEFTLDAYVFLLQRAKDLHRIISPKSEIFSIFSIKRMLKKMQANIETKIEGSYPPAG